MPSTPDIVRLPPLAMAPSDFSSMLDRPPRIFSAPGLLPVRSMPVAATGIDLTGNNPGAENIRGGLSSIEEKSLGAIAKGGSRTISGVLGIAEWPSQAGLYVMDGPGFSPESLTAFAAAGAQLMLFTTGAGNSFCNSLAPTLKVSARPHTIAALPAQIDFDASELQKLL